MWKCFLVARRDYKHQKHGSDSKITYLVFKVILTKKVLISNFSVWHELNFSTQGKIEIFDTDIYIFLCFLIISIVSYVKLFKLLFILQDSPDVLCSILFTQGMLFPQHFLVFFCIGTHIQFMFTYLTHKTEFLQGQN